MPNLQKKSKIQREGGGNNAVSKASEDRKWKKTRRKAIKETILKLDREIKHYEHLLRKDDHLLKDCELRKFRK